MEGHIAFVQVGFLRGGLSLKAPDQLCRLPQPLLCWRGAAEDAGSDAASMLLRGFAYQAVGQLAARAPQPFQANPGIAAQMFAALGSEPPGIRASLQEAVSSMAAAYQGCSGVNLMAIADMKSAIKLAAIL